MQLQVEKLFCYCLVGVEVTRGADTVELREQADILYIIMIVRWCL